MAFRKQIDLDLETYAQRFGVCHRTIRRWHAKGVNLADPEAVADHLLRQKNNSRKAMAATLENLNSPSSYVQNSKS